MHAVTMSPRSRAPRFLMLLTLIMLLGACGQAPAATTDTSATTAATTAPAAAAAPTTVPAASGETVELRIGSYANEAKAAYAQINAIFEKENPNIKVVLDMVPTDQAAQYRTARLTNGDIDILFGKPFETLGTAQDRDNWLDLSGRIPNLANVNPDIVKSGQVEGKQLIVPHAVVTFITYYNKQIFKDLGLSAPKTWSEFVAICEKLQAANKTPILVGGKDGWPIGMQPAFLEPAVLRGHGNGFYQGLVAGTNKFTDPPYLDLLTKMQTLGKYYQKSYAGTAYQQTYALFAKGEGAMLLDGTWAVASLEDAKPPFDVGTFFLPATDDQAANKLSIADSDTGGGWLVYKNSPHVDAALKWLDFFYRPDISQQFANLSKLVPTAKGVEVSDPLVKDILAKWSSQTTVAGSGNLLPKGSIADGRTLDLVAGKFTPQQVAEKMQQEFTASKPNWEK